MSETRVGALGRGPTGPTGPTGPGGGGGSGASQRFAYTVNGTEPDLSDIVIPLPAARPNAGYLVQVTQAIEDPLTQNFLGPAVKPSSRTGAQFRLLLTSDAAVGDTFWFTVDDPT